MRILESFKKRWTNYIERLGAANARNFGDEKLDCCSLNRTTQAEARSTVPIGKEVPHE